MDANLFSHGRDMHYHYHSCGDRYMHALCNLAMACAGIVRIPVLHLTKSSLPEDVMHSTVETVVTFVLI